jgi:hypothetical protein
MIAVFKTDIPSRKDARHMIKLLQADLPHVRITIDMDDCDKVLRLEGPLFQKHIIVRQFHVHGYNCIDF